ncbi:MAG: ATP-binding protein, partial [Fidelibacterota bacterium]
KNETNLARLAGENRQQADLEGLGFFKNDVTRLYHEFMIYGGYPEVVLTDDFSQKKKVLQEIVRAYILKDIRNIFQVEKIDSFNNLVKTIALQVGQLLNNASLARDCRTTRITAEKYCHILEDTFIIQRIPPLFTNKKKELRRMPKVYFHDSGLRNYLAQNFLAFSHRVDRGQLLENAVFSALWKTRGIMDHLYFWHTADGKEVDFIVQREGDFIPFEVKVKRAAVAHLKRFNELYNCPEMNLVRLDSDTVQPVPGVNIIPPWII